MGHFGATVPLIPIRRTWETYLEASGQPRDAIKRFLDVLDLVDGGLSFGISARSIARTEWVMRLSKQVLEAGYGRPTHFSSGDPPTWTAPQLIRILGVSETLPHGSLRPHTIFAAEVLGPLSGEPEEKLRARPGLQHYYERRDHYRRSDVPSQASRNENEADEDSSQ